MNCQTCKSKTEILETRIKGQTNIRKRYCPECHVRFETTETFSRLIRASGKLHVARAGVAALEQAWGKRADN